MKQDTNAGTGKILPGPGCRIEESHPEAELRLIRELESYNTADIADQLNRMYAMRPGLKNVSNGKRLTGPACTVRVYPGDNLMVHKALDLARPGDVIVVDAGDSKASAVIGGLIATKAKHRGIAGFVIDGLVRDIEEIAESGLPVYARGVTPVGPLHIGPGEINYPLSCGGIVVNPGDIVCADVDGIVVVPNDWSEEVVRRLKDWSSAAEAYFQSVHRGEFSNEWVDRELDQIL